MRFSAFFRVFPRPKKRHKRSQNNLFCLHRSQNSRLCFKPPLTPLLLRFPFRVFRVFRGEPWFPVENTVMEQAHAQLARAKAQATVSGPRNPRSRHSAFFCVLQRPKERHTHALKTTCSASTVHNTPASAFSLPRNRQNYDFFSVCSVSSVLSHGFRLKTPLWNKRMRDLPGLKPRLRFLARAIRGHVIPRSSAFFSGQKKGSTRNPVHNCRLHCQRC